jgi:anti-sigma regulatory factor (Ser/Thr protein kinase)
MISTARTTGRIGPARNLSAVESHRLPGTLASANKARRLVEDFLDRVHHSHLVDAATLVISEIVTNAVRHGHPPVHLDLAWLTGDRPALRVDVHDHGHVTRRPEPTGPEDTAECGRGLFIVESMTDRWSLAPHPVHGTHAWFEIEASAA